MVEADAKEKDDDGINLIIIYREDGLFFLWFDKKMGFVRRGSGSLLFLSSSSPREMYTIYTWTLFFFKLLIRMCFEVVGDKRLV